MNFNKAIRVLFFCTISSCLGFLFIQFQRVYLQKRVLQKYPLPVDTLVPLKGISALDPNHSYLKSLPIEMVPDLLNPGNFLKPNMSPAAMETEFIKWIKQIQVECIDRRRLGNEEDGGWDVCFDPPFQMTPNNCLVYSFGIARDWSFDDDISRNYSCKVHSFDPSIHKSDHNRSDKISFHNLGLGGSTGSTHSGWKMDTLNGIRRTLGHQNKIIDYLKMDIERSELTALPAMFQSGDLWTVKQLGFEVHVGKSYNSPKDLGGIYLKLLQLELIGFRRFHYNDNFLCNRSHEIYYLNTNFIKSV